MQKYFILLLSFIIFLSSCTNPNNPNEQNNNIQTNQSQRGEYKLLTDESILSLSWSDQNKQEYFRTNWLNTFTNQIIVPAGGVTTATRETDEKGTYLENGDVLGNFIYATNIEWKGTNWIGALYEDPRRPEYDSKWMLFHIDTEGNLMLGSGLGTGASGSTPPTDNDWKTLVYDKWGAYSIGTIKDFNYNKQQ